MRIEPLNPLYRAALELPGCDVKYFVWKEVMRPTYTEEPKAPASCIAVFTIATPSARVLFGSTLKEVVWLVDIVIDCPNIMQQ